jgi:dipeptidase D
MQKIKDLKPSLLWKYFDEILRIPRPSKKEGKIIAYLEKFAFEHHLKYKKDIAGNILVSKSSSPGYEKKKVTILQCHVDMVCEKNEDSSHNFEIDPIEAYIEDGWIKAKGTTLGADNGIGIAAQLAILADNSIKHGPVECLFTVDEETGLTGAFRLEPDFLNGEILLNLDSEDEGELFVGCAGGANTIARIAYQTRHLDDEYVSYSITVKGLTGGHSGDDIHKGYGNSIKILTRFLWNATQRFKIRLCHIQGGHLHNAIPREAKARIAVKIINEKSFLEYLNQFYSTIKNELKITEPNLNITYNSLSSQFTSLKKKYQKRLLYALHSCPNGVIEMNHELPDLVETSTNLAAVEFIADNIVQITTSQRSSLESAKMNIANQIESLFMLVKAKVTLTDTYPGWTPNTNSEILKITKNCYKDLYGIKPKVKIIHAGLECGLFLKKYPGLDMISFGPTIKGAHSPAERLEIMSVEKFWYLITRILENIPET